MQYRKLGNSGLRVSAIGLGTNYFGRKTSDHETATIIDQALDLGINFLDTANVYGKGRSEETIGKALKGRRHKAIIATKFGRNAGDGPNDRGASRQHIMEQVELSLQRLRTDYIDLYQLHIYDDETPIGETLLALHDLVREGKVRYIGCSGVAAWQACDAAWIARELHTHSFVSIEAYYNLLRREAERDLLPFCRAYGLGFIPYFPLESGFLAGRFEAGQPLPKDSAILAFQPQTVQAAILTERNFSILSQLREFCDRRNRKMHEAALAWLLARAEISTVIVGATTIDQVRSNIKSLEWKLDGNELAELNAITADNPWLVQAR